MIDSHKTDDKEGDNANWNELKRGSSSSSTKMSTSSPSSSLWNCDIVSVCAFSINSTSKSKEYWLESLDGLGLSFGGTTRLRGGVSWKAAVQGWLLGVVGGGNIDGCQIAGIIRLDRWLIPGSQTQVGSHSVHSILVPPEMKAFFTKKLEGQWLSVGELLGLQAEGKVASVEVVDTILALELGDFKGAALGTELYAKDIFLGLDLVKQRRSGLELIVQAAQLGKNEQVMLYKEFLKFSLPFLVMGPRQFGRFMAQLGWTHENELVQLYRTFDMGNRGGITFRDLLCGLAVVEPGTQHGGPPAEVRCRYIFRYFDKNIDGRLDFVEFRNMVAAIRREKGLPDDADSIQADAEKSAALFGDTISDTLGQTEFLTAVGQLKFRGTSHLLRSHTSIVSHLKRLRDGENVNAVPHLSTNTISQSLLGDSGVVMETDVQVELQSYDVATHCVRVKRSGTILDIHSLWDIEHSGMASDTLGKNILIGGGANRIKSLENFNQTSKPNEMLNGLRYFERQIIADPTGQFQPKPQFDWGLIDRSSLAKCIISLCQQVTKLLAAEPRLIQLASPVYIMGDIHGNFPDLLCFEKALWRLGPFLTPASFLFLGDYVDRGAYSVEVIAYLFSHKIASPHKFFLLRGNHEIREVQQMFTFYSECITKFGDNQGKEVWDAVNESFDCMPLAAVIDKKVFCAHGGIPPPWISHGMVSSINSIPVPLPQPEEQSKLAWELMWSDPIHIDTLSPEALADLSFEQGFADNKRRGTGHVFSFQALDAFLQRNHFSHVIRAHEVQQAGFKVQLGGKLLTVFSSSKYCGGSNEAACILADKYKLRTIRIDTT